MGNNCCKQKAEESQESQKLCNKSGKNNKKYKKWHKQNKKTVEVLKDLDEIERKTVKEEIIQAEQKTISYEDELKGFVVTYHEQVKPLVTSSLQANGVQRIPKELSTFPNFLPLSKTNSIFISSDRNNITSLFALITGCSSTPYAYGAFVYKIDIPHNYPSAPPKVILLTTGSGAIRFNPNLYSCGKVCLSLLGTWNGVSNENWTPSSNLAQVLLSIQSIVMNQDVYFNQPGYEAGQNDKNKKLLNQGYKNIVKISTLKYAINQQLESPFQQFKEVIKKHFKLVKQDVIATVNQWIQQSENPCKYQELVQSHNWGVSNNYNQNPKLFKQHLENELAKFIELTKDHEQVKSQTKQKNQKKEKKD